MSSWTASQPVPVALGLDPQQLLAVVPLVERLGLVQALVALQPHERAVEVRGERLGQLGLADAGRALDQHGLAEPGGEVGDERGGLAGQVADGAEAGVDLADGCGSDGHGDPKDRFLRPVRREGACRRSRRSWSAHHAYDLRVGTRNDQHRGGGGRASAVRSARAAARPLTTAGQDARLIRGAVRGSPRALCSDADRGRADRFVRRATSRDAVRRPSAGYAREAVAGDRASPRRKPKPERAGCDRRSSALRRRP